jgi:hypothetical protein
MKKILLVIFLVILCVGIFPQADGDYIGAYREEEDASGDIVKVPLRTKIINSLLFPGGNYLVRLIDLETNKIVIIYYVYTFKGMVVKEITWMEECVDPNDFY